MDILVVLENKGNKIHRLSLEAIAGAQKIGGECGLKTSVLAMGKNASALADEAGKFAVDDVLTLEHDVLNHYTADGYSEALANVITTENPAYVFFGHTYQVRDFVPRISAKLKRPFLNDVVSYKTDNGKCVFTKQAFNSKLMAELFPQGDGTVLVSFQSATFSSENIEKGLAEIRAIKVELDEYVVRVTPEDPFQEETGGVDLSVADLIVSVGRGIGKEENIPLAQELAKILGAELGSSRPVVDSGWLPSNQQVGSSGQSVSPKLYLALGISGAIQHVVGMKGSKNIVAINKDPEAPIFEIADYGVVGDILEIIPKLTEALS